MDDAPPSGDAARPLAMAAEDEIKRISRDIRNLLPQDGDTVTQDHIQSYHSLFDVVFATAESRSITTPHRVAAWNTLCALIDQCANSYEAISEPLLWVHGVWERALMLYVDHSRNARPKSSKQLLSTLSGALRKHTPAAGFFPRLALRLSSGISSHDDADTTKACVQILAHFFSKDIIPLHVFLAASPQQSSTLGRGDHDQITSLLVTLFEWVGKADFGSAIGQLISIILNRAREETSSCATTQPVWATAVDTFMRLQPSDIDAIRIHILPQLFSDDLDGYVTFLYDHGLDELLSPEGGLSFADSSPTQATTSELLFAALRAGKELGILHDTSYHEIFQTPGAIHLPASELGRLLSHASRNARLTGLSVLIVSRAATRPLSVQTFRLLRRHLSGFFADTDPNFRSELFSLIQRLMDRIRAITGSFAKEAQPDRLNSVATGIVSSVCRYRRFLSWFVRFLAWELRPTASYQRHISALKSLAVVVKSGLDRGVPINYLSKSSSGEAKWAFHLPLVTQGLRRLLLDLLSNPFDDVRQIARHILSIYNEAKEGIPFSAASTEIEETIERSEKAMLQTGRADQADGVAHMYKLLYDQTTRDASVSGNLHAPQQRVLDHLVERLEQMLQMAKISLATASKSYPMHGLLISLRYILSPGECDYNIDGLPARLLAILQDVWDVVKPILCNDAPEGYVPEDEEIGLDVSTKDTLSYCWRALKESSMLLATMMNREPYRLEVGLSLANLCFTELAELRHRGAFSTVAQTWAICCANCNTFSNSGGTLLRTWYDRMIEILLQKTIINTRRSAGLPALFCGLLVADKDGALMTQAFQDLTEIAQQPLESNISQVSNLSQVHAMNCIKDILKNTRLGEQSERYVPQSVRLAADAIQSQAWALRNCGLMLFRGAVDRLLGTNDAYLEDDAPPNRRLSTSEYPQLLDIVIGLLTTAHRDKYTTTYTSASEGVFPALQLLQRVQIPKSKRAAIRSQVLGLTTNPSWHVRDKAARTYATMVSLDRLDVELAELLGRGVFEQNALHGVLLTAKYLIIKLGRSLSGFWHDCKHDPSPLEVLNRILFVVEDARWLYDDSICFATQAAYVDIDSELQKCLRLPVQRRTKPEYGGDDDATVAFSPTTTNFDVFQELSRLTDQFRKFDPGDSILLKSLACGFAVRLRPELNMSQSSLETVVELVERLAKIDLEACCLFFATLRNLDRLPASHLVFDLCMTLQRKLGVLKEVHGRDKIFLASEIDCTILHFAYPTGVARNTLAPGNLSAEGFFLQSPFPLKVQVNQQYADQWLQMQALATELQVAHGRTNLLSNGGGQFQWIEDCALAIRGEGIYTREAAAWSIDRLDQSWRWLSCTDLSAFRTMCLSVYDLLNDDDEDLRLHAVTAIGRLVGSRVSPGFSPKLDVHSARQQLLRYMCSRWRTNREFAKEAFSRAFAISGTSYTSPKQMLIDSTVTDTALFAEEKQNLYLDDSQEVRIWAQVINLLDPQAIPKSSIKCLTSWVMEGIAAMTAKLDHEKDGALGWTTRPEIFVLGLQLIYAMDALLHFVEKRIKLPVRPSILRSCFGRFVAAASQVHVNTLWMWEIDRASNRYILQTLETVGRTLGQIAIGLNLHAEQNCN